MLFELFSEADAYVLLGAPGSGKTVEFQRQAVVSEGHYVTARDFLTFDEDPAWNGVTLFIDGLDEQRAGRADGRTPLDAIRAKLARLGCPRFRLSCREADWFGSNDRHHLKAVSPDHNVRVFHLDPLSEEDEAAILETKFGIEDARVFIGKAREQGVDELLINPQSLGMLARAVADENWPSTRTETFEMACRALLREPNQEHRMALPQVADSAGLMRASGKLFAVQLLTGAAGFERLDGEGTRDYIALEDVPDGNHGKLRLALRTQLFKAPEGDRALPFHRQIAEFVAGRYLAELIADGLPWGRVLALMTGHDGAVVTDLRGLCGWVAAQSHRGRVEMIARDPLGTVLYGDAQGFTQDEKRNVLGHLERSATKNPRFVIDIGMDSRLGDLVYPGMKDVFLERTTDSRRDDGRQSFVLLLVEMLTHGKLLEGVAPRLLEIVRDETWWPRIRHGCIEAFLRQRGVRARALADLKGLTQDVYAGAVADPDDDLLGSLLDKLYPDALSESEVLDYLRAPKRPDQILSYEYFWTRQLAKRSNCEQMAQLLDRLVETREWLYAEVRENGERGNTLRRVPSNLLERYLSACQDEPDPGRLFDWLGVAGWVGDWKHDIRRGSHARERIRAWIGERPELFKTLMELGLQHCIDSMQDSNEYSFDQSIWMERERRLFNAPVPQDFACWCLDQAVRTDNRKAATWLMYQVADAMQASGGKEVSRNAVEARVAGNAVLQRALEERLEAREENEAAIRESRERPAERLAKRQMEWQTAVRESGVELLENRAGPGLLHPLARAYMGKFGHAVGQTPRERLSSLVGGDEELVETALAGLHGAVFREDLPSDEDVVRLSIQQRMHNLTYAFLAGLDEMYSGQSAEEVRLDTVQARLALTMHYNVAAWPGSRDEGDGTPRWLSALLKQNPELVADVLVRTARSRMREGWNFLQDLYELAHSADHKTVARLAALPLLSAFPVRCVERQLPSLRNLLLAACQYCEREAFLELIERKLATRSMNVAQRVYWLGAGIILRSAQFLGRLESYVGGHDRRVWHVSQFLTSRIHTPRALIQQLDAGALSVLIRVIGGMRRPYTLDWGTEGAGRVTPGMEAADRVNGLIGQLANDASSEASKHLESLSVNEGLVAWRAQLIDARNRQNAIRRDASFEYATVGQVVDVLNKGEPANVADLAALLLDVLRELAVRIRDEDTSDWRQYWNKDSNKRPTNPIHENLCRDALLSDLRSRVEGTRVDLQPEVTYADDKRCDISARFGGFNVPVEIKKSCHRDVWSAIRSQLIAKYTRDPDTDGHGIYVVFWFGDTEHCRPTPGVGGIPTSAGDVEQRLLEGLSAEERKKIGICLIDVSKSDVLRSHEP